MPFQFSEHSIVRAARALYAAYQTPDVAAFNRAYHAKTERGRVFWQQVGRFLFVPYRGYMGWTNEDVRRWRLIRGE